MEAMTALGILFDGNTSINIIVLLSAVVPVIVVIVIVFVFFRAARRNDEREALEKQAGSGPAAP
jgi:uncharacterized membrane protein YqiK